jgi:hypothetical protein
LGRRPVGGNAGPGVVHPDQETRFAELLARTANLVAAESGPTWASDTLRRLAGQRALPPGGVAANATVRVVFGWERSELGGAAVPADLRAGLLCTFRLLAESGYDLPVRSPHVFDASFLDALREDVRQRVTRGELRGLDHDWHMLGDGVLTGTSGALAIWLAQNLAAGLLPDRRWTLPPWVVVTATLDPAGDGTGGAAGPVGLLREKAEVLVEEGVRVMVVATRDDDSDRVRRQFGLDGVLGAEHLLVLPVQVGQHDVADLAGELKRQRLLWPVRLDAFGGRAVEVTPEEAADLIDRRQEPHVVVSAAEVEAQLAAADARRRRELECDYIPPVFALQALEAARRELPGRGVLHLTAPAMWGKSFLVLALRHGWKPDEHSAALGRTIGWAVLHGRPENPGDFLHDLWQEAMFLGGDRPLRNLPAPHDQRTIDDIRRVLREVLKRAKKECCAQDQP